MTNLVATPDPTATIPAWDTATPLLGGDGTAPLNRQAQALLNLISGVIQELSAANGAQNLGFLNGHTLYDKVARTYDIDDYASLSAAFTALGGAEGTGYGAGPVVLNLQGKTVPLTADTPVPTNISLSNGTISGAFNLIWRNPYIANTALRAAGDYWDYMTAACRDVTFDCRVLFSGYIGKTYASWDRCKFTGAHGAVVFVNVDGLWTEYTSFDRCFFASNATDGAAIIMDGNVAGTSAWQAVVGGTSAGTSDGSFGYNKFLNCKIDAASGADCIVIDGGATPYNGVWGFAGYVRGNSNAFVHIKNGRLDSLLNVQLESFGATGYGILLDNTSNAQLWYCSGQMRSASPQMRMSQGALSDVRSNTIDVQGFELQDQTGSAVFNGDAFPSQIRSHVSIRQSTAMTPVCRVYKAANQALPSNADTVVVFDANVADSNTYVSANRFQPKVAGWYFVCAQIVVSATSTATASYVSLYRNATVIAKNDGGGSGASMTRTVSTLVYLNGTTNYIEVHAFMFDNAGAGSLVAGADSTNLNCVLVRTA